MQPDGQYSGVDDGDGDDDGVDDGEDNDDVTFWGNLVDKID